MKKYKEPLHILEKKEVRMNNTEIVRMIEMLNQHLQKPKSYYVNGGCLAYAIALQKLIGGQIV